MRFCKYIFIFLLVVYSCNLYGQSKIKCDLLEIAQRAFDKSPIMKRSAFTIQDAEANLQVQRSVFDFNSYANLGVRNSNYSLLDADPRNQFVSKVLKSNTTDFSAGFRKLLRSGQTTDISLNYGFNNSNLPFNSFNENVGAYWGNHLSTVNVALTQPLMRGRGRDIATIGERTSYLFIENSKRNNEFVNSSEILQIGFAYWNYYTAFKNLEIYKQNESRVRNVLGITNELVKADKKPAGDIVQINADLVNQEKLTILAEQNLYETRLNLGRVIGLSNEESLLLDIPLNEFPTIATSEYRNNLDKNAFIKVAREKRADLNAVRKISEALLMQYKLAENNAKPQLDLTGFLFHGSASTGNGIGETFSSFTNNQGRNMGAGARLTFTFPVNNNLAKGNLAKSNIALNDQKVANENLQRNIEINISNALNNLNNSVLVLEKAKQALDNYKEAFSNEQVKFQTGLTTILSLILFQERLTSSELQYLQAYQQFAYAIVNLRHETGTLISQDNKGFSIESKAFYLIPNTDN
jgi:outer membrane protein TolC